MHRGRKLRETLHVQPVGVGMLGQPSKKYRPDITPYPGGHRPQHPCAQGRTRAKQDQAQSSASGQNWARAIGGAATHGRMTRQASESVPTQTQWGAGGCTPQTTHQAGTLRQDPSTGTSCAKGTYGPGQLQGRAGTGQDRTWQQQRGYDWSEVPLATPPPCGPYQNTPGRGHPGGGQVLQQRLGCNHCYKIKPHCGGTNLHALTQTPCNQQASHNCSHTCTASLPN